MDTIKNPFYRRSKISRETFEILLRSFARDATATEASAVAGVSVRAVNDIYLKLRKRIWREDLSGLGIRSAEGSDVASDYLKEQREFVRNPKQAVEKRKRQKPKALERRPISRKKQDQDIDRRYARLNELRAGSRKKRGLPKDLDKFALHDREAAFRHACKELGESPYDLILSWLEREPL